MLPLLCCACICLSRDHLLVAWQRTFVRYLHEEDCDLRGLEYFLDIRSPILNEGLCVQLVIVRSYTEVQLSSEELFMLLTSEEGAKILDDTTNHTDPPLATLDWKGRYMYHADPAQVSHACTYFVQQSSAEATAGTTPLSCASIHVPHKSLSLLLNCDSSIR